MEVCTVLRACGRRGGLILLPWVLGLENELFEGCASLELGLGASADSDMGAILWRPVSRVFYGESYHCLAPICNCIGYAFDVGWNRDPVFTLGRACVNFQRTIDARET